MLFSRAKPCSGRTVNQWRHGLLQVFARDRGGVESQCPLVCYWPGQSPGPAVSTGSGRAWILVASNGAISADSLECMLLPMEVGLHRLEYRMLARMAVGRHRWRCAELLSECSKGILPAPVRAVAGPAVLREFARAGKVQIENLRMAECLEWTAKIAARSGDVRALQSVREIGAEWDGGTLRAALRADSLACLRYADEGGCPYELFLYEGEGLRSAVGAQSFPLLQYVHEHMDPAWAAEVLKHTALELQDCARLDPGREIGWRMVHYLAQHLGRKLPLELDDVLAVQRGRAAALGGCVNRASRLAVQLASDPSLPMWAALAAVPNDLWRQIAIDAQILLPSGGIGPLSMEL